MNRRHPNRPPKRRCPSCGGDHHAWQELALCNRCKRVEEIEHTAGVTAEIRGRRKAAAPPPDVPAAPVTPYNEFPAGF